MQNKKKVKEEKISSLVNCREISYQPFVLKWHIVMFCFSFSVWFDSGYESYWILHIRFSMGTRFHLQQTILNFRTKYAQKKYLGHHSVQHIRISLCIKFRLKLTTSIFWTKFTQKEYFWSKKRQKVNIIIEICISEMF